MNVVVVYNKKIKKNLCEKNWTNKQITILSLVNYNIVMEMFIVKRNMRNKLLASKRISHKNGNDCKFNVWINDELIDTDTKLATLYEFSTSIFGWIQHFLSRVET